MIFMPSLKITIVTGFELAFRTLYMLPH